MFFLSPLFFGLCFVFDGDDTLSQDKLVLAHLFLFRITRYISKSTYFLVPFGVVHACVILLLIFSILASTSVKGLESLITLAHGKMGASSHLGDLNSSQLPIMLHASSATSLNPDFCPTQKNYRHAKLPKYLREGWQRRLSFVTPIPIGGLMTVAWLAVSRLSGKRAVVDKQCPTWVRSTPGIYPPSQF